MIGHLRRIRTSRKQHFVFERTLNRLIPVELTAGLRFTYALSSADWRKRRSARIRYNNQLGSRPLRVSEHSARRCTRKGDRLASVNHYLIQEGRQYEQDLSIDDGLGSFGPTSLGKGELELTRLRSIYHSISKRRFVYNAVEGEQITANLLVQSDGTWCAHILTGPHRTAVAAALDMRSIPVRYSRAPVKREEVEYWLQVRAGRITRDGALAVFD